LYNTLVFSVPKERNLVLKLDPIPDELPDLVITDELKLKQILINLISNAIKFTREGMVSYGCNIKDKNTLVLYVKDTGMGIKAEYHQVIFDRFRQIESGQQMNGGSGLGLAIVKAYTKMLDGTIEVDSEPGKGAEFTITLPLQ